jgi:hypothetical protein
VYAGECEYSMTVLLELQLTSRHKVPLSEGRIQHTFLHTRNMLYRTSLVRSVLRRVMKTLRRKLSQQSRSRALPSNIHAIHARDRHPRVSVCRLHLAAAAHQRRRARSNRTSPLLPPPSSFLRFGQLHRKQGKSPHSLGSGDNSPLIA